MNLQTQEDGAKYQHVLRKVEQNEQRQHYKDIEHCTRTGKGRRM